MYEALENEVLRDMIKSSKEAGFRIKELLQKTRMNPEIRERITYELLWVTSPRAASIRENHELRKQSEI